jgi:hypothetical protein
MFPNSSQIVPDGPSAEAFVDDEVAQVYGGYESSGDEEGSVGESAVYF